MDFGLDNCAKATFVNGKLKQTVSITLDTDVTIEELRLRESYKYQGINERDSIHPMTINEKLGRSTIRI